MEKFYSEKIDVELGNGIWNLKGFKWRGKKYRIVEVKDYWQDWNFPLGSPPKRSWRLRKRRTCFIVITDDGKNFEIYLDRKGKKKEWFLLRSF